MTDRYLFLSLLLLIGIAGCSEDTHDCPADMIYNPVSGRCEERLASCDPGSPQSIVQECADQNRQCYQGEEEAICGVCLVGFRSSEEQCVAVVRCESLDCAAENRTCIEAGENTDAHCGQCLTGMIETDQECVQANCSSNHPGSIKPTCDSAFKTCVENENGAVCGDCWHGYVPEGNLCQPAIKCYQLLCVESNRFCIPEAAHTHAMCGPCMAGFSEQDGVCMPKLQAVCDPAPAPGSILAECEAQHRYCLVKDEGAVCGGCKDGYIEDVNMGLCIPPAACEDLDCAALNRACEDEPTGHCTGCLAGFIQDENTGECRATLTCSQITCQEGEECAEATSSSDAFCREQCGPDAIWSGVRCEPCPPCDALGEVGRWPWLSMTNNCICETEPGFFYSLSAEVGSFPCDDDSDGWVRESARVALESADPAIVTNARCDLRIIDRFVLRNESELEMESVLDEPLELYESDRNDDDFMLSAIWQMLDLPGYGVGLGAVTANQLNRLTKLCHDPRTDYNDNSIPDVEEWGTQDLAPGFRVDQRPFNEFSYFMEFYRGWYLPPMTGDKYGSYLIAEKSRLSQAPDNAKVAVGYPEQEGDYWRTCRVDRDSEWVSQDPPIGMDLAKHQLLEVGFFGMNHHSQFKCLVIDDDPDASVPNQMSTSQIEEADYRINTCRTEQPAVVSDTNPAEPIITCEVIGADQIEAGDVAWAAIPYIDHGKWAQDEEYLRGCVNECILELLACPGYELNPKAVDCVYDPGNFGKFVECLAWEMCDGYDNDFDGEVDEDNPEGGAGCEAGFLGQCNLGQTRCQDGQIVCDQVVFPIAELCNGSDDNCDGFVDDNDPQGGGACTIATNVGRCQEGIDVCQVGVIECVQDYQPTENEEAAALTCNKLDDDCNGETDPDPPMGAACDTPRKLYFPDNDGDGYGDYNFKNLGRCLCGSKNIDGVLFKVTNAEDRCDKDKNSSPKQTNYSTDKTACKNYDWNSDGDDEKQYTETGTSGCGKNWFRCHSSGRGWAVQQPPACGDTAAFYNGCGSWWSNCPQDTIQRTQSCR